MALTFAQARTMIQARVADSSDNATIGYYLNQAQREVARARRWPELMVTGTFFTTVAAYSTGTVAVANAGTTWTLTGGTYPTDVATGSYRIALSLTDPWYTITTRTDGTHVETATYQEDTETASAFVAYKSHYSLAAAVDRVEEVWLHRPGGSVRLVEVQTDDGLTDWLHHPSAVGVPSRFYNYTRDSSGNKQLLLGPETPDDVYRVEYVYRKKTTDDTFVGNLDESRWPVIVARAQAMAYEAEYPQRAATEMARYQVLLREEWGNDEESETPSIVIGQNRALYPEKADLWQGVSQVWRVID